MPPESQSTPSIEALDQAALRLVDAARSGQSPAANRAVSDFRERSAVHEASVKRAERFYSLSQSVEPAERSFFGSVALRLDIWLARWGEYPILVGFVGLALVGLAVGYALTARQPPTPTAAAPVAATREAPRQTYETRRREQMQVALPDGSTVWLDWRTRIAVRFSSTERTVDVLDGTAAFAVVSDSSRPFVVEAQPVSTQVTGTEFVVTRQQASRIEVAVLEGSVRVRSGSGEVATLGAESVVVAERGELGEVTHRSVEEIGRWRDGMLVFRERPLVDALRELEPYTSYTLDTTYLRASAGRVSGVFFTDKANDALATILQAHQLEPIQSGSTLVLQQRPPARPQF